MVTVVNQSVEETAALFWIHARLPEVYPRDIEQAAALVLPIAVVRLPVLTTSEIGDWLSGQGVGSEVGPYSHDLMGCLVASRGYGILFVSGADTPEEQRLTIAHEVAHFLKHYVMPRARVIQVLGPGITAVLDGDREATAGERIAGVLSGVRVGAHVHLLPRPGLSAGRVAEAESEADDLGLELVAPRSEVVSFLRTRHVERLGAVDQQRALASRFGLPAHAFAQIFSSGTGPTPFLADVLNTIRERSS
jgi:hypothetical protein